MDIMWWFHINFALGPMYLQYILYIYIMYMYTGWWFGTFVIFPCIGNNHPN